MEFHTTAPCTTGTVSLGSRGRCFFSAGVLAEEADDDDDDVDEVGGVAEALDIAVMLIVAGEEAVKETMVTGMGTGDCEEALLLVKGTKAF